jgi:hypothetical protein
MDLDDLKNNPTLIQTNLKIRGPKGAAPTTTLTINSTVVTKTTNNTYAETIGVIPGAVVAAKATVGGVQGDGQWIEVAAVGDANCYWLPWGEGKVYMGSLGSAHEYFFTYAINGCGVIIGGATGAPVVAHANLDCKRLNDAASVLMKSGPSAGPAVAKEQALIYEQFYGNLAAKLIQDAVLSPTRLEVVTPQQYLIDAKASFGAVFGIRKSGGWEFYGNWAKKTTKIWP